MRKLNREELRKSKSGNYWVKLTRLYEPKPVVVYEGPAQVVIQIREKDNKEYKAGTIALITTLPPPEGKIFMGRRWGALGR